MSKPSAIENLMDWLKNLFAPKAQTPSKPFAKKPYKPTKKYPSMPKKANYTHFVTLSEFDPGKPGTVDSSLELVLPEFKLTGVEMHFEPGDDCPDGAAPQDWAPYFVDEHRMGGKYVMLDNGSADCRGEKKVAAGDLLLLNSTFRLNIDGVYSRSEVIFGYFEVDRVRPIVSGTALPPWQEKYRVLPNMNSSCWDDALKIIISARKTASWNEKIPGAGIFRKYNAGLKLTPDNASGKPAWQLPPCVEKAGIIDTYPTWENGLLYPYSLSSPSYKDIRIRGTDEVLSWARDLIEKSIG